MPQPSTPAPLHHPALTLEAVWREHGRSEERLALSLYSLGVPEEEVARFWRQADTMQPDRWQPLADRLATARRHGGEPVHDYPALNEVLRACTDPGEDAPQPHNLAMAMRALGVSMREVDSLIQRGDAHLAADRIAIGLEARRTPAGYDTVRELRGQGEYATATPRPVPKPKAARAAAGEAPAPAPVPAVAPLPPLPAPEELPGYLRAESGGPGKSLGEGVNL